MLPATRPMVEATDQLRAAAARFMNIDDVTTGEGAEYHVRFRGRLLMDSIEAYPLAAESFRKLGYTPLFRKDGDTHVVLAVAGTHDPRPSRAWVNLVMFGLTVFSVALTGAYASYVGPDPVSAFDWLRFLATGVPFAVAMLGILLAHELGHYFAARYHKVAVTLPYFIPFPLSPFGTMGAFIQLKAPPTNRRVLLDIGVAGPFAGLIVALPILIYGLATSPVGPLPAVIPPGQLSSTLGS